MAINVFLSCTLGKEGVQYTFILRLKLFQSQEWSLINPHKKIYELSEGT